MIILKPRLAAMMAAGTMVAVGLLVPATDAAAVPVPAACGSHSLTVSHTPVVQTAKHSSFVLLYRNVTGSSCSIHGYPGLDALDTAGHVLAHARRTLSGAAGGVAAAPTATVPSGGYASATVEWADINPQNGRTCTLSRSVATTPANTFATVRFPARVGVCALQIHPTVSGTSRNTRFAQAQLGWQQGAHAVLAVVGLYWERAESALKLDGSKYTSQINQLRQLIALPDADQSATQNATFRRDIAALDNFFGTTALYQ